MPRNTHQHSQQRRCYIDVFPEYLEEAAEMLAGLKHCAGEIWYPALTRSDFENV
jgi:hypothetical protein